MGELGFDPKMGQVQKVNGSGCMNQLMCCVSVSYGALSL